MALKNLLIFFLLIQLCTKITSTKLCNHKIHNNSTFPDKFPTIFIFGDSTVDTGNNNYIPTLVRGNHPPYGHDFPGKIPKGRFSNGKLIPNFLASMLRLKETVPSFLQPDISDKELLTGVCFASGGSGLDELMTAVSGVIPMLKKLSFPACSVKAAQ